MTSISALPLSVSDDLLYAETALAACGIRLNDTYNKEFWSLLRLIRRRIKMSTAFIVDQNANRILFSSVKLRGYQSFKVCGDILADTTVRPELVCKLKHGLRSYLGVSLRLEVGRSATLIVVSPSPRVFSSNDIALACELCACIEDRYQMRNEAHIANTVSNLSITSTLLSGIKMHLEAATACLEDMDAVYLGLFTPQENEEGHATGDRKSGHSSLAQLDSMRVENASVHDGEVGSFEETSSAAPATQESLLASRASVLQSISRLGGRSCNEFSAEMASHHHSRLVCPMKKSVLRSMHGTRIGQEATQVFQSLCEAEGDSAKWSLQMARTLVLQPMEWQAERWKSMMGLVVRFETLQRNLRDAIERSLLLAQHYTARDQHSFHLSCFQEEPAGLVEGMNAMLCRLAKMNPDHSLLWCYNLPPQFAHCAHRTLYDHLTFFLEGLAFRWAPHSSSTQIKISYDAQGVINLTSTSDCNDKTAGAGAGASGIPSNPQLANESMLTSTLKAYDRYLHTAVLPSARGSRAPSFEVPEGCDVENSAAQEQSGSQRRLNSVEEAIRQHVLLSSQKVVQAINTSNVGRYDFDYSQLDRGRGTTQSKQSSPMLSASSSAAAIAMVLETPSSSTPLLDTILPRTGASVQNAAMALPPQYPAVANYLTSLPRVPSSLFAHPELDRVQHGYLHISFQPLDLESPPVLLTQERQSNESLQWYRVALCSMELLNVLGAFLREIDPHAAVSLYTTQSELGPLEKRSIIYSIALPCYFHLPACREVALTDGPTTAGEQYLDTHSPPLSFPKGDARETPRGQRSVHRIVRPHRLPHSRNSADGDQKGMEEGKLERPAELGMREDDEEPLKCSAYVASTQPLITNSTRSSTSLSGQEIRNVDSRPRRSRRPKNWKRKQAQRGTQAGQTVRSSKHGSNATRGCIHSLIRLCPLFELLYPFTSAHDGHERRRGTRLFTMQTSTRIHPLPLLSKAGPSQPSVKSSTSMREQTHRTFWTRFFSHSV